MPARTRAVRAPKAPKENIDILGSTKTKNAGKTTKSLRKPLADKTNSASDENASPEPTKKVIKKTTKPSEKNIPIANGDDRPRRNRRLPPRYVENEVLNNLSNNKENCTTPNKSPHKTPVKNTPKVESPFKTPTTALDNSLIANRPKRVSRLPSKFDENSESPNRFVPTHCHTSTPLVAKAQDKPKPKVVEKPLDGKQLQSTQKISANGLSKTTAKQSPQNISPRKQSLRNTAQQNSSPHKNTLKKVTPLKISPQKATPKKVTSEKGPDKVTPQKTKVSQKKLVQKKLSEIVKTNINTDVNVRQERVRRLRKAVEYKEDTLSPKLKCPETTKPTTLEDRKKLKLNSSFRVLEERNSKGSDNQDIYEFTFDPTEEPTIKKKKKKVTSRKPAKPKTRFYNNNYEKNIARALADLKNVVTKQKPVEVTAAPTKQVKSQVPVESNKATISVPNPSSIVISTVAEIHPDPAQNTSVRSNVSTKNHVSYRVEDIAADFDASMEHDINYSPVTSPHRIETEPEHCPASPERVRPDDPLNLRNDLSFFDDQPVANSSMNVSKNPTATPWRVEFENLPIKWQANTYVKPDMTPALECSFVNNFDDSKKKHVYTNIVAQTNDALPEIEVNEAPKLKQTSIISYIKEVVERSSTKKKRGASATPTKANSLFDMPNEMQRSVATPRKDTSGASNESADNHNTNEGNKALKRKNDVDNNPTPAKLPRKDNENTLFGFDDSGNQENVSPVKVVSNNRLRSLRSRSGAVLKELNKQTGPMRAELPAAMKAKLAPSSDAVEKIYNQIKSATDAPMLLDKQGDEVTNIADNAVGIEEDSQSVHLFEDIELVHHLKPTRKSYGKAKKVTFQNSSDSEEALAERNQSSDDEGDNLEDLSFHLPEIKTKKATKKKKTKKQTLSKKEKAEVDAWAACFNSMCEDIEEFDLVVE